MAEALLSDESSIEEDLTIEEDSESSGEICHDKNEIFSPSRFLEHIADGKLRNESKLRAQMVEKFFEEILVLTLSGLSNDFCMIFHSIYPTGSFFDGLQVIKLIYFDNTLHVQTWVRYF